MSLMSHRKDDTLHLDFLTPNLVLTLLSHLTNDELFIFITAVSSTLKTIAPLMVTHISITYICQLPLVNTITEPVCQLPRLNTITEKS